MTNTPDSTYQNLWLEFEKANAGLKDYLKPYKTPSELVEKLISHGITIDDRQRAEHIIYTHNYYRLKAYFVPFIDCNKNFVPGTTFMEYINIS
jgi:abortive infection bacteriophage resistance protein